MMDLDTNAILQQLESYISNAYPTLFKSYAFFTCAMFISCIVIPLFIVRLLNQIEQKKEQCKAYILPNDSSKGFHQFAIFLLICFSIGNWNNLHYDVIEKTFDNFVNLLYIGLIILALTAAWGLFRFRIYGLFTGYIFILLNNIFEQYIDFSIAYLDSINYIMPSQIDQYIVYIGDEYLIFKAIIKSILTLVILCFFTVYYRKRRFLFMPSKIYAPFCTHCGQVISSLDTYCTSCGHRLILRPQKNLIISLDKKKYCGKCGYFTLIPVCFNCCKNKFKEYEKTAKRIIIQNKISFFYYVMLFISIFVLICFLNNHSTLSDLTEKTASINNNYTVCLNEFIQNPDIALDSQWLASFDYKTKELYISDARWFFIDPRSIQTIELEFFWYYIQASFNQMIVLENIQNLVHSVPSSNEQTETILSQIETLYTDFNTTINQQAYALQKYQIGYHQKDIISNIIYWFFDQVRIIYSLINITVVSITMVLVCIFMLVYVLKSFIPENNTVSQTQLKSYIILSFLNCIRWIKSGLTSSTGIYQRPITYIPNPRNNKKTKKYIYIVLSILFIACSQFSFLLFYDQNEEEYLSLADTAVFVYAKNISVMLSDIYYTHNLTYEDKESLFIFIDNQIIADKNIIDYDISVLEKQKDFHDELCTLCSEDIQVLKKIKETLNNGLVPSQELMMEYVSIRGETYVKLEKKLVNYIIKYKLLTYLRLPKTLLN